MSLVTVAPSLVPQFDPDQFLKDTAQQPFDPDAFLHDLKVQEAAKGMTPLRSALRGAGQGATMGWGDELAGAVDALPAFLTQNPPGEAYAKGRDEARLLNEAAHQANRKSYISGEVAGGVPYSLLKNAPVLNTLLGATQGAGYNRDPRRLAGDILGGAAGGFAGGESSRLVGQGASALRMAASRGAARAGERATQQATNEVTQAIRELASSYGGEVQKGNRFVENLRRLEGSFTPEQRVAYDQLKSTGVIDRLEHQLAESTLASTPGQAETILTKKGALEAAQQAAPQTIADRTAELSKPTIGADVMSLVKSYGEPLAAAALAPVGMKTAAGMIFGRTRMGKALALRAQRPGNQIAAYDLLSAVAGAPNTGAGELLRNAMMRTPVPLLLSE